MLNKHLLDDNSVLFNFEFMAWLIRGFGAPHAPPVPSPLHRTECLSERAWSDNDQRSVYIWAEDELAHIKSKCHMENWNIITQSLQDHPLPYEGTTAILAFNPDRCHERGYFTACALNRLSEILIHSRLDTDNLAADVSQQLKILTICYLGQGFTLTSLTPKYLKDFVTKPQFAKALSKKVVNRALFGTALVLACRRFSAESLSTTYGSVLSKPEYKKLWGGFKQLDDYDTEVQTLKMLCGKGDQPPVAIEESFATAG